MTDISLFLPWYTVITKDATVITVLWHTNGNDFSWNSPCLLLWVICHFLYGPVEESWAMGYVMKATCIVFSKTPGRFDGFSFCRILRRCPSNLGKTACCYPWGVSWWHQIKRLLGGNTINYSCWEAPLRSSGWNIYLRHGLCLPCFLFYPQCMA